MIEIYDIVRFRNVQIQISMLKIDELSNYNANLYSIYTCLAHAEFNTSFYSSRCDYKEILGLFHPVVQK